MEELLGRFGRVRVGSEDGRARSRQVRFFLAIGQGLRERRAQIEHRHFGGLFGFDLGAELLGDFGGHGVGLFGGVGFFP